MVTDNDEKHTDPNNETVEEGIEMLIEKLSFLLDQLGIKWFINIYILLFVLFINNKFNVMNRYIIIRSK